MLFPNDHVRVSPDLRGGRDRVHYRVPYVVRENVQTVSPGALVCLYWAFTVMVRTSHARYSKVVYEHVLDEPGLTMNAFTACCTP